VGGLGLALGEKTEKSTAQKVKTKISFNDFMRTLLEKGQVMEQVDMLIQDKLSSDFTSYN
jgi:hypothetical protein